MSAELDALRQVARTDPDPALLHRGGQALIDFKAARTKAREALAPLEAVLFPPAEPTDG